MKIKCMFFIRNNRQVKLFALKDPSSNWRCKIPMWFTGAYIKNRRCKIPMWFTGAYIKNWRCKIPMWFTGAYIKNRR